MSVSAYDPLYIDLWRDGGTKGVELLMPKNDAVALRHRLYRLRAAMLKESHPLADTAERGSVSIKFAPKAEENWIGYSTDKQMTRVCAEQGWELKNLRWKLCIFPPDARFADALAAAGYKSDLPPPLD